MGDSSSIIYFLFLLHITVSAYSANIRKMYALRFFLSLHFIGGVLVPFFLVWGGIRYSQIMLL